MRPASKSFFEVEADAVGELDKGEVEVFDARALGDFAGLAAMGAAPCASAISAGAGILTARDVS